MLPQPALCMSIRDERDEIWTKMAASAARNAAAQAKNFAGDPTASATSSPRMGIVLKDSKDGTTWEVAR